MSNPSFIIANDLENIPTVKELNDAFVKGDIEETRSALLKLIKSII